MAQSKNRSVRRIRQNQFKGNFTALIYNGAATRLAADLAAGLTHLAGEQAVLLLRDPNDLPLIGKLLGRGVPAVRNFARSDHVPFWNAGIPALMVTDTANFRYHHYHQTSDTPEKLDYNCLSIIGAATAAALARVAGLIL
jgi:Zn-dependent M28 family amino/carboxypeptidase